MLRRRMLMEEGGSTSVPYDAEVSYLLGDGHQYIDLPITPDSNTGIYIKVEPLSKNYAGSDDMYIIGLRNNTGNTRWCIGKSGSYSYTPYYAYGGFAYYESNGGRYTLKFGIPFEATLNYLNSKVATLLGGYTMSLSSLSFTPSYGIRMFGSAGVNANYTKASVKIYSCKISQGTNIVMDLIPVRKDGIGYFYDKIGGGLYGNNGTSSFTIGNDVS